MSNTQYELLRIAGTVNDSIVDGPGFRFSIFAQGCRHNCPGCHNPQTHDFNGGEDITVEEIMEKIKKNSLLSGVTLSGGDPFEQAHAFIPLAQQVKALGLELAAYTGYTFEQLVNIGGDMLELLKMCDVLIDGPFILEQKSLSLPFRGSKNQRILNVRASLEKGEAVLMHDERWLQ